MKIADVRCFQVTGPGEYPPAEARQVGMLDIYPEHAARSRRVETDRPSTGMLSAIYVEVTTDDGPSGVFGPIFPETAALVRSKLAPHLVGQDPLAAEKLWDVMYRQDRHAPSSCSRRSRPSSTSRRRTCNRRAARSRCRRRPGSASSSTRRRSSAASTRRSDRPVIARPR